MMSVVLWVPGDVCLISSDVGDPLKKSTKENKKKKQAFLRGNRTLFEVVLNCVSFKISLLIQSFIQLRRFPSFKNILKANLLILLLDKNIVSKVRICLCQYHFSWLQKKVAKMLHLPHNCTSLGCQNTSFGSKPSPD